MESLSFLGPMIELLEPVGRNLTDRSREIVRALGLGFAAVIALLAMIPFNRSRERLRGRSIILAFAVAIAGQIAFLERFFISGVILYSAAAVLMLLVIRIKSEPQVSIEQDDCVKAQFGFAELLLLTTILVLAVVLRFYALNRIVDYFEGEASPFSAAGTDLRGMLYANIGERGPWSPFGYLYYIYLYVITKCFGTSLLALRFVSAIIGVITIALMYGLMRKIGGRATAATAAFLMALDPLQISWGRSDIFPHASTTWIAILLCWLTLKLQEKAGRGFAIGTVLLMGLSFHQYPSGQVAFLIPIGFYLWGALFGGRKRLRSGVTALPLLVLGAGLWVFGLPFQYLLAQGRWIFPDVVNMFGARTSWASSADTVGSLSTLLQILSIGWNNFYLFLQSIFIERSFALALQDLFFGFPGLPPRLTLWLVPPCAFIAITALLAKPGQNRKAPVLLIWAVVGMLPLLLSNEPQPRRAAIAYPALFALAAVGLRMMRQALEEHACSWGKILFFCCQSAAAAMLFVATLSIRFSGRFYPYGEPYEISVARALDKLLEPGTVFIIDTEDGYMPGKLSYLMLDSLTEDSSRPNLWLVLNHTPLVIKNIFDEPGLAAQNLATDRSYKWTKLWYQIPETKAYEAWSKIVLVSQTWRHSDAKSPVNQRFQQAFDLCPHGSTINLHQTTGAARRMRVLECKLDD